MALLPRLSQALARRVSEAAGRSPTRGGSRVRVGLESPPADYPSLQEGNQSCLKGEVLPQPTQTARLDRTRVHTCMSSGLRLAATRGHGLPPGCVCHSISMATLGTVKPSQSPHRARGAQLSAIKAAGGL